jgi:aminopeptidase
VLDGAFGAATGHYRFLNTCNHLHYLSDDIDISFSTAGRTWINSDGRHNMPSGEVFTSPVEDSVTGWARFSFPGLYLGREIEGIELYVEKGEVVKARAARGEDILHEILRIPGANRFGEAAIGTNHGITRFTRNMLFDEKIGGTVHLALGSGYAETGSRNQSAIHLDLLADMRVNCRIIADGREIYRNGHFDETILSFAEHA